MKKSVVVINGTGGCGKDTFITFCKKYASVTNFSSIDKVKEVATLIGWNGKKTEKDRKFLSDLKKLTTEYNDMAFESLKDSYQEFINSESQILFFHIREPEEVKRATDYFNAKSLLIKREGLKNISTNVSDANVDNYNYDYIIENTTLEKFEEEAKRFVEELTKN